MTISICRLQVRNFAASLLTMLTTLAMLAFALPTTTLAKPPAERFTDIAGITLESPAFTSNKRDFTSEAEGYTYTAKVLSNQVHAHWKVFGKSAQGRDLSVVILSADGRVEPTEIAANRKPTVWILAGQHGNEPAGVEAAYELTRRFASAELKPLLDKINVLIIARANPDGLAAQRRETSKTDLNRDHLSLHTPEANALAQLFSDYPAAVLLDLHEYTPAGAWLERLNALETTDLMYLSSHHPYLPEAYRKLSKESFEPALVQTLAIYGIKHAPYHTTHSHNTQVSIAQGGLHSGIARNAFALKGALTYLLESRGIGMGRDYYQRRVASLVLASSSLVRSAASNAEALKPSSRELKRLVVGEGLGLEFAAKKESKTIALMNAQSFDDKTVTVEYQNYALSTTSASRTAPLGWVIHGSKLAVLQKLSTHNIRVHRFLQPQELELESYTLTQITKAEGADTQERWQTELKRSKRLLDAQWFFVPAQQALGRLAFALLEPEVQGSLAQTKAMSDSPLAAGDVLPVWRVVAPTAAAAPLLLGPALSR